MSPRLYLPAGYGASAKSMPVVSPVGRMLLGRHVERLTRVAERWEDEAGERALAGNPKRAGYLEAMAEGVRVSAQAVALEPIMDALAWAQGGMA